MVMARIEGEGEAYRRCEPMRDNGEQCDANRCETWLRPLADSRESGFPAIQSSPVRPTIANADRFPLPSNELRPDWRKWPKNGRPARTPHRTRPILLGSPRRLFTNLKTLNRLRRYFTCQLFTCRVISGCVWLGRV